MRILEFICLCVVSLAALSGSTLALAKEKKPIPAAILPFESRGDVKEEASQIADLLFANLIASENISLVERQAIESVFQELKLSKAGVVKADEATEIGKLTGAKLLITGSALQVNGDLYLVAKVIGTETSRLSGASVKGAMNADLGELVKQLAAEIDQIVATKAQTLLPKVVTETDWLVAAKNQLKDKELPSVTVSIKEQHIGQHTFDPAVQTECEHLLTELGFNVISADNANSVRADILIKGEAVSQTATRHADFVSVKCRVETQVVQQADGKVVTSDSETTIGIDLAEQIAAKSGLQEAARKLLQRVLPKLVK